MTDKGKPRWPSGPGFRPEVCCQNPAHDVLVDVDAEGQRDLLGDALAAPSTITPFHFNDRVDQCFRWSFGTGPADSFGRKQQAVLLFREQLVKTQESRWLQHDRGT